MFVNSIIYMNNDHLEMSVNEVAEEDKAEVLEKCGLNRARRNVLSYAILSISNLATIGVGLYSGGTVPAGLMLGNIACNGVAHFLKCSARTVDKLKTEKKTLKTENKKLKIENKDLDRKLSIAGTNINTMSSGGSLTTPPPPRPTDAPATAAVGDEVVFNPLGSYPEASRARFENASSDSTPKNDTNPLDNIVEENSK